MIIEFCDLLNPINLWLKWTVVSFEDFQVLLMELHRRIDMLSAKLTINHDSAKNQKIRQMAWITNTVEDDMEILEEMFWPTPEEIIRNRKMNQASKKWLKE